MLFVTLILMGILTGAEVDLFIPSFPELQSVFGLTPFMVELTLSVNLIAHCFSALIAGNMGDRYGRKPVILGGLVIFTLGSLLCVFATQFWVLLLGRALQGIGISGPAVLSYVVLADLFSAEEQQRKMGILNGIITLAMAMAPVFGSYVSLYCHWQGNFVVLLLLGISCLLLGLVYIPEGRKNPSISLSLKEYWPILTSPNAMRHIFMICLLCQGYWMFIGISPILYVEDLGVSLDKFGFYQGSIAGAFSIISLTGSLFLKKWGQQTCLNVSFGIILVFAFLSSFLILFHLNNPLLITGTLILFAIGLVLPVNIFWPLSLEIIPEAKGRFTAFFCAMRLTMTALGLQLVSYFYEHTYASIGIAMNICIILGGILYWQINRHYQREKSIVPA